MNPAVKTKIPAMLRQLSSVVDLDEEGVELLEVYPSKYGRPLARPYHIHELLRVRLPESGAPEYVAKAEDVLLKLDYRRPIDYRSFAAFTRSLFEEGEGVTPRRAFAFSEDPEIPAVEYSYSRLFSSFSGGDHPGGQMIAGIQDDTPPSEIADPELRSLFILYLARKEKSLLRLEDGDYEFVYQRHGRDIINEVLASVLGQLLSVPVPENRFGLKDLNYSADERRRRIRLRYVLSRLSAPMPVVSLQEALATLRKSKQKRAKAGDREADEYRDPGYRWHEANPCSIAGFESNDADPERECVLECFACSADLIRSDVLDRLLGTAQDRKLEEFLLPFGNDGPIHTVDYGEGLFPELEFAPEDRHYCERRERFLDELKQYVRRLHRMAPDCIYRNVADETLERFAEIPPDFFSRAALAIPRRFLWYHWDEHRPCYRPDTLADFFERLQSAVRAAIGEPEG